MKDEYILGEGYPVFSGTIPPVFCLVGLSKRPVNPGLDNPVYLVMDKPIELESVDCDKYELILRRVK